MNVTSIRSRILFVAWPIILSNISVPLLGLVDTAVIGNLGDPALLGAIAVGGMIFSFLYWGFGFLRMGTTGLVAQASGAERDDEVKAATYRAAGIALIIAVAILALQVPLQLLALHLVEGSQQVESGAADYFRIRIWAAPFSMLNMVVLGYFLGQQQSRIVLMIQLLMNGINIVLDLVFVIFLGLGVAGVASATVIAEAVATMTGLYLVRRHLLLSYGSLRVSMTLLRDLQTWLHTLAVNRDIMIRTLCLIFAFAWFTNEGAMAGDIVLASNAILMQFVSFSAFFLDGFALAGESLVGRAVGSRQAEELRRVIRHVHELGLMTAILLSTVFYLCGPMMIDGLTSSQPVRDTARQFLPWAVLAPVTSLWCYMLDGIFIGATCTREMRDAMIASLLIYLGAWALASPALGNHGLWLALHVYFLARAACLAFYLPRVYQRVPGELHSPLE